VFAGSALLLAAIGIYGLMAYSVEQRTQEIGIRLVLGRRGRSQCGGCRDRRHAARARSAWWPASPARSALRACSHSFLFGVQARDPMVFVAIPVLLSLVALAGVWLPAIRANRVDPQQALRYE
jgi:hypothetical protein